MYFYQNNTDYRGSILSQIFFSWLDRLFYNGIRRKLSKKDLHTCPREQCSRELFHIFDKYWQVELQKDGKPDLKIAIAKTLKTSFLFCCTIHWRS